MIVKVYDTYDGVQIEDFEITETQNPKTGNPVYKLVRVGTRWTESHRGEVALSVEDTGDGYSITPLPKKDVDYATVAEIYIMLKYLNTLGTGLYKGEMIISKDYETIPL